MHNRPGPRHCYVPQQSSTAGHAAPSDVNNLKDTPLRSLIKALTYCTLASSLMFVIFFILFRSYSSQTFNESIGDATMISISVFLIKLSIFYAHERIWTNIKWGKYWQKQFWKKRAWRRHFRKLHK